jgi:hypothetical protein
MSEDLTRPQQGATAPSETSQRPTKHDAELLIRLYAIAQEEHVYHAFLWYYEHFGDLTDPKDFDHEAYIRQNRRGSEGYAKWTPIASFFETVGVLVRHGAINEALVLDRWPVDWYWRYLEPFVQNDREAGVRCDTAWYADNFEWLAQRAADWRKAGKGQAKWESGRATNRRGY